VIRNLTVDFKTPGGRVHALCDVSFDVPRAKIVGVVGESVLASPGRWRWSRG